MKEPNETIVLFSGSIEVYQRSSEYKHEGIGQITTQWFPHNTIAFSIKATEEYMPTSGEVEVVIQDKGIRAKAFITSSRSDASINSRVNQIIKGIFADTNSIEVGISSELQNVTFHLINFLDSTISSEDRSNPNDLALEGQSWRVTINAVENKGYLLDKLKLEGGYAITHTGRVEKCRGEIFTVKEMKDIASRLFWFVSFLKGSYCSPVLLVGFDKDKKRVWEHWNVGNLQSDWQDIINWFPRSVSSLSALFNNYLTITDDKTKYEEIKVVVNWYVECQRAIFTEQGIMWAQLGIEALSWIYFMDAYISKEGFGKLPMADRLRLLLSTFQISTEIPQQLVHLSSVAKEYNWDGPGVIAEMRNRIAHPNLSQKGKDKLEKLGASGKVEVRRLCQWYLELALLRFFGYSGEYHNRFHIEQNSFRQEVVPWAKNS